MSDAAFARAVEIAAQFSALGLTVSYEQKLALYGLFKRSTIGAINTTRPGLLDVVGRSKFDSWKRYEHLAIPHAKSRYLEVVLKVLRSGGDRSQLLALTQELLRLDGNQQSGKRFPRNVQNPQLTHAGLDKAQSELETDESEAGEDQLSPLPQVQYASTSLVASARAQHRAAASRQAQKPQVALEGSDTETETDSDTDGIPQQAMASKIRAASPASSLGRYQQEWLEDQRQQQVWQSGTSMSASGTLRSPTLPPPAVAGIGNELESRMATLRSPLGYPTRPLMSPSQAPASAQHLMALASPRSPAPRPPSRPGSVPLESTLQAIHQSLTLLHERISALERSRQPRKSPAYFQSLYEAAGHFWQALSLPWTRQSTYTIQTSDRSILSRLVSSFRDASFVIVAVAVFLRWKQQRKMADIWRGFLYMLDGRRRTRRIDRSDSV